MTQRDLGRHLHKKKLSNSDNLPWPAVLSWALNSNERKSALSNIGRVQK